MTVMTLPKGLRRFFRTSNHIERLNKELKRHTHVIGIYGLDLDGTSFIQCVFNKTAVIESQLFVVSLLSGGDPDKDTTDGML